MTNHRKLAAILLAGFLVCLAAGARAEDAQAPLPPWKAAPFTSDPRDLLIAASALDVPGDADIVMIYKKRTLTYDDAGRLTSHFYFVYRIAKPAGVGVLDQIASQWSPWYEERPELRARVVTRDGRAHVPDPNTFSDAPARQISSTIFSDERVLRAPLPALAPGAVVEQEIVVHETTPYFAAGVTSQYPFDSYFPVLESRLEIDAPSSLHLRYGTEGFDLKPVRTEQNGRVHLVFSGGPYQRIQNDETYLPDDVPNYRMIAVSTGDSWPSVARAYSEIVDEKVKGSDVTELTRGLKGDRESRIAALVDRLHHEVRYTGLEFGESSIVPAAPDQVLHRKYGDCKDKSTLLVAALRRLGYDAHLALLLTGPDAEVDPNLPGLGQFDHAIVYVDGKQPMWIDATAEFSRLGVLPIQDEGRLALIAEPSTTGLVKIPESTSGANHSIETREVDLADMGKGRIVETTVTRGLLDRELRSSYSGTDQKAEKDWLTGYAKQAYGGTLGEFSHSDPRDLLESFRLTVEVKDASQALTSLDDAAVAIVPQRLLARLPDILTNVKDDDKPRKHDFLNRLPYVAEWHYVIKPPEGYVARPLPDAEKLTWGTARFSSSYRLDADGRIEANFLFDSGKRRLTPEEFKSLRTDLDKFGNRPSVVIGFEQSGHAHLARGEVRQALENFRALVAKHPKSGIQHARVALAYLAAGLGQAARDEIAEAVRLEPDSALVHQQRAWILQHDLLGRFLERGFDRDGAAAEYAKAFELDKDELTYALNRAIVLEYDLNGVRYGPGSRIDDAIAQYRAIEDRLDKAPKYEANLPTALTYARRFAELRKYLDTHPSDSLDRAFGVIADVGMKGPSAVPDVAGRIFDAQRRSAALETAARTFTQLRMYPEAAALMAEAAKGSPNAAQLTAQADMLRKIHRYEDVEMKPDDPTTVVRKFMALIFREDIPIEEQGKYLDEPVWKAMTDDEKGMRRQFLRRMRRGGSDSPLSGQMLADFAVSLTQFAVEGDATRGFRVRSYGTSGAGDASESFYVVKRKDGYRILGSNIDPKGVGLEVLARVDAKRIADARVLLDWLRDDQSDVSRNDDPLAGPVLSKLWNKEEKGDEGTIRRAAASLLVTNKALAPRAIPILEAGRKEEKDPMRLAAVELSLATAYLSVDDTDHARSVLADLNAAHPGSDLVFTLYGNVLNQTRHVADAEALAKKRLDKDPKDLAARRLMASSLAEESRFVDAFKAFQTLTESGDATAMDYNDAAWFTLGAPQFLAKGIEFAQHADKLTDSSNYAILNTLAALYAEDGKTQEAKLLVWKSMDSIGEDEPRDADWYVLGRIAEQFGLRDAALAAYGKVKKSEGLGSESTMSVWSLSQKRLAAMEKTKGAR